MEHLFPAAATVPPNVGSQCYGDQREISSSIRLQPPGRKRYEAAYESVTTVDNVQLQDELAMTTVGHLQVIFPSGNIVYEMKIEFTTPKLQVAETLVPQ